MAYIGKEPQVGNYQICDAISVVNGQAAYTMQVSSTNVSPESANHMIVSLNGIIQKPGSSFTISGSTITFASNLATGDVIDYIMLLGNVLDLGVPSDDTVGAAQIKDDLISGTTALSSEPADTDEFLVSDAGTLKRMDYSLIKSSPGDINFKNRLINGDFSVAQRGTSFTSTGGANNDDAYHLDRWYVLSDTHDVVDITQSSTAPTNQLYSCALDVETANKKFGIAQIIENKNCTGLIGQTATLSFKAKCSAVDKLDNVKAAIISWSSTADSVTSDFVSSWGSEGTNPTLASNLTYENTPANLNLTTSFATYSVSASIDTSSTTNVGVFIWSDVTDTTAGQFIYITDVQLEVASSASDFERLPYDVNLTRCQRYLPAWHATSTTSVIGFGGSYADNNAYGVFTHPVTTRIAPTGIVVSTASHLQYNGSGSWTTSSHSFGGSSRHSLWITSDPSGISTHNPARIFFNNATAYMYGTGCEL